MTISRRAMLMGLAGSGAAAAASYALPALTARPADGRRKFLFIAVDDLRPMMGHYGDTQIKTPHLDELSRHMVSFDNAYTQVAVCGASRAALFTALRPEDTGMVLYQESISKTVPKAPALHSSFKAAGFETVGYGKLLHFDEDAADGWSEPVHVLPRTRAPGISPDMPLNDSALDPASQAIWTADSAANDRQRRQPFAEAADVPDNAYRDGAMTDMVIERLNGLAKKDDPFFLAIGYGKPHLPFNAPKRYWDLYDRAALKLTERKVAPTGAPPYAVTRGGEIDGYSGLPKYAENNGFNEADTRHLMHGYMACVSYVDAQIGRLIASLKANGLWDEVVIVLWGDHGYKLGDYNSWTKHTNYEIDTRVPLMLRVPGMADKGERSDALVETVDIFPTLLQLAAIPIPQGLQGLSFAPLLADPKKPWKSASFSQFGRSAAGSPMMGYSVRTRNFRYVMWKNSKTGQIVVEELYDHRTDPLETRSLARDPRYATTLVELRDLRTKGWKAALPKGA